MRLHIDFETRSTVDLRKTGVYRYAEDQTTEVILACYALDDKPVKTWFAPNPCPKDLADRVADMVRNLLECLGLWWRGQKGTNAIGRHGRFYRRTSWRFDG